MKPFFTLLIALTLVACDSKSSDSGTNGKLIDPSITDMTLGDFAKVDFHIAGISPVANGGSSLTMIPLAATDIQIDLATGAAKVTADGSLTPKDCTPSANLLAQLTTAKETIQILKSPPPSPLIACPMLMPATWETLTTKEGDAYMIGDYCGTQLRYKGDADAVAMYALRQAYFGECAQTTPPPP